MTYLLALTNDYGIGWEHTAEFPSDMMALDYAHKLASGFRTWHQFNGIVVWRMPEQRCLGEIKLNPVTTRHEG